MIFDEELNNINNFVSYVKACKEAMRHALIGQEQDIPVEATLDTYADYIAAIEGGGGTVYTVQYLDWDDTVLKSQQVLPGGDVNPPSDPIRDGWIFAGWDISGLNVQSDLVITAQYTYAPNLVAALDYDLSLISLMACPTGSDISIQDPTQDNMTFTGWSDSLLNVQGNRAIIARYNTTSGRTYFEIELTAETGLSPTFYYQQWYSGVNIQIFFGDGQSQYTESGTGGKEITHTYPAVGTYIGYFVKSSDLQQVVVGGLGASNDGFLRGTYANALKKVLVGSGVFIAQGGLRLTGVAKVKTPTALYLAFSGCTNLTRIVLNSIPTNTNGYVFSGCTNLETIVFTDSVPSSTVGVHLFDGVPLTCEIYVPDESVSAYQTKLSAYSLPIKGLSTLPLKYQ